MHLAIGIVTTVVFLSVSSYLVATKQAGATDLTHEDYQQSTLLDLEKHAPVSTADVDHPAKQDVVHS